MYNISPTKFPNSNGDESIWDGANYGPIFGGGHDIRIKFDNNDYTSFPHSYKDVLGNGYSIFKGDNENDKFNLKKLRYSN